MPHSKGKGQAGLDEGSDRVEFLPWGEWRVVDLAEVLDKFGQHSGEVIDIVDEANRDTQVSVGVFCGDDWYGLTLDVEGCVDCMAAVMEGQGGALVRTEGQSKNVGGGGGGV